MPQSLLLTCVLAAIAHYAFLQAPDYSSPAFAYVVAAVCSGLLAAQLRTPVKSIGKTMARSLAVVLVFVGAGYSTPVEPGVIKLFGEVPLGWTCAVLLLMIAHARTLASLHPLKLLTFAEKLPASCLAMLTLATVMTSADLPGPDGPKYLEGALVGITAALALLFVLLWLQLPGGSVTDKAEKD
jgi:hypothetical protein